MGVGGFHCCIKNNLKSTVIFDNEDNPHEPETSRINKVKVSRIVFPTEVKRDVFELDPQIILSSGIYDDDEFNKNFEHLDKNPMKGSYNS